jgi:hypothetical protein
MANYDKLLTDALALSGAERARRFKQFVQEHLEVKNVGACHRSIISIYRREV